MKGKKLGLAALAGICAVTMASCLVACNKNDTTTDAKSFVTLDINPSVEMIVDKDNTVLSVAAANTDAEVLLWQEDGIVGAKLDVAVGKIASAAFELGFIKDENKNISVSVSAGANVNTDELYNTVKTSLVSAVNGIDSAIELSVDNTVDLVLGKELEAIKAANAGKDGYGDTLSVARYRLVKRAMAADRSLKMDNAVKMSTDELAAIVEAAQSDAKAKFGEACNIIEREAQFAYEASKQAVLDSVYTGIGDWINAAFNPEEMIYQDRTTLERIDAMYYGSRYTTLRLAYSSLEHYYASLRDYIENPVYTLADAQAVVNAMGTAIDVTAWNEFKTQYADENGNFTAENIKAFINKTYRNLPEESRQAFEAAYALAKAEMDKIDQAVTIETIDVNGLQKKFIAAISTAQVQIGVNVNYLDFSDVEAVLAAVQTEIDKAYANLNLTDAEKQRVKAAQDELQLTIDGYADTLKSAISKAEAEAEAWLNEVKNARKSAQAEN